MWRLEPKHRSSKRTARPFRSAGGVSPFPRSKPVEPKRFFVGANMPIEKDTATILRRDEEPYMALSREVVQSIRQSEALSIWIYLQSKPLNWTIRKKDIMESLGLGEDRYKKGMDYLKSINLITTALSRDNKGKLEGKIMWCHARPHNFTEIPENRTSGKPNLGKTELRENTTLKDIQNNKDLQITKNKQNEMPEIPDYIDQELWKDFMDLRKSLRAKNTPRAIKALIKELEAIKQKGHDPNRVITISIMNSWKSVFEPKAKYETNKPLSALERVKRAQQERDNTNDWIDGECF